MLLSKIPFVVTDTETTGINPGNSRIIEIGAVKVLDGKVVDRYESLIDPNCAVPHRISRLTGITTSMVYGKRQASEVLPEFKAFLGDGVLVAHNLAFDKRFLNSELRRLKIPPLRNKSLCTVRLARRLLSGLRSKGLSSLADFYGIRIKNRHRALGDADATALVFLRMLAKLKTFHKIEDLHGLLAFQMRPYRKAHTAPEHVLQLKRKVATSVPRSPGVYFMLDRNGKTIYIGKAKNLRSRVRSYFSAIEAHPPKTRDLVRVVRDVRWETTPTELAALLRESRLIKENQPRFNRALRRHSNRPFIRLSAGKGFPTVSFSSQIRDDGSEYFGPLRGNRHAKFLVDIINRMYLLRECDDSTFAKGSVCMYGMIDRCCAPCVGAGDVKTFYADEVSRVRAFLTGEDDSVLNKLHSCMLDAADALEFEEAREFRDWWNHLNALYERQKIVATPVLDHNATLILPTTRAREFEIYFIRYGRVDRTIRIRSNQRDWKTKVVECSQSVFAPLLPRPERYERGELDEIRILSNWLYHHRQSSMHLHWKGEPGQLHANQVVRIIEDYEPGSEESITGIGLADHSELSRKRPLVSRKSKEV